MRDKSMDAFLNDVAEQMRCKRAREPICEELKQHILEQAEDFEQEGLEREAALERAVLEMGDPVEIGAAMDRIHRPRVSYGILLLTGVIGVFSILFHIILAQYNEDVSTGNYYMKRQILYIVAGYVLMLLVYRLDYSFFQKKSKIIAGGLLAFVCLAAYMGNIFTVHGSYQGIRMFGVVISGWLLTFLYVPIFAAVLYDYRGMGYGVLWRILLWAVGGTLILRRTNQGLSSGILLFGCLAVLFTIAVAKGWYRISVKKVLIPFWSILCAMPICLLAMVLSGENGPLLEYQRARLENWLHMGTPNVSSYYTAFYTDRAEQILSSSSFMGRNVDNLRFAVNEMPGFQDDYTLISLVAVYGVLAGVLAVALLLGLVCKIFHVSFAQKNQLGMIMGCGCGLVFLSQIVFSVGVNLGWLPICTNSLPFFCYGGNSILLYYILLGLVLSIYRYKDIPAKRKKSSHAITA